MTRIIFAIVTAFMITGCVSTMMKKYVGKDIREVYMEHGKPSNEFVMKDGRRVFQFNVGESSAGSPYGLKDGCLISYITTRDEPNNSWVVVDYRYPDRLIC